MNVLTLKKYQQITPIELSMFGQFTKHAHFSFFKNSSNAMNEHCGHQTEIDLILLHKTWISFLRSYRHYLGQMRSKKCL